MRQLVDIVRLPSWLPKSAFLVAFAAILLAGLLTGEARKYFSADNPPQDIVKLQQSEVDYHRLYPELESKSTFADTFYWWHNSWRPDTQIAAYWRPLSMQAWWLEMHAFGEDRSYNWMRISLILTLAFEILLGLFLFSTTKSKAITLIAVAGYALPGSWIHLFWPLWPSTRVPADLLLYQGWKDQPDLFCNCLTIGAMLLAYQRKYAWAFACACLAVCFKESGLLAFPLAAIMIAADGQIRETPKWLFAAIPTFLIAMMAARYAAGPDVFHFRVFANTDHWLLRYLNAVLPESILSLPSLGEAIIGVGLFALLFRHPKTPLAWLTMIVGLAALGIAVKALQTQRPLAEAFAQFMIEGWQPTLLFTLWLLIATAVYKDNHLRKWALIFIVCGWIAALPYARLSGALDHVLVFTKAFQWAYVACAAVVALRYLRKEAAKQKWLTSGKGELANTIGSKQAEIGMTL